MTANAKKQQKLNQFFHNASLICLFKEEINLIEMKGYLTGNYFEGNRTDTMKNQEVGLIPLNSTVGQSGN